MRHAVRIVVVKQVVPVEIGILVSVQLKLICLEALLIDLIDILLLPLYAAVSRGVIVRISELNLALDIFGKHTWGAILDALEDFLGVSGFLAQGAHL